MVALGGRVARMGLIDFNQRSVLSSKSVQRAAVGLLLKLLKRAFSAVGRSFCVTRSKRTKVVPQPPHTARSTPPMHEKKSKVSSKPPEIPAVSPGLPLLHSQFLKTYCHTIRSRRRRRQSAKCPSRLHPQPNRSATRLTPPPLINHKSNTTEKRRHHHQQHAQPNNAQEPGRPRLPPAPTPGRRQRRAAAPPPAANAQAADVDVVVVGPPAPVAVPPAAAQGRGREQQRGRDGAPRVSGALGRVHHLHDAPRYVYGYILSSPPVVLTTQ